MDQRSGYRRKRRDGLDATEMEIGDDATLSSAAASTLTESRLG